MKVARKSEASILEYVTLIKDQYPDLTEEQLIKVLRSNFKMISTAMASNDLCNIRIKYLGTFVVYPGRVKGIFKNVTRAFDGAKVDKKFFNDVKQRTENYLTRNKLI